MNLLVPYSATNKKIVMGLLSYIPEFKDFKRLQEEIEEIATNPSIKCWLYKESDSENFIGLIGGESTTDTIIIKYLSVSPSFRGENITFQMLEDLAKMEDKVLSGTIETSVILAKWNKHRVSEEPWKI